MATSLYRQVLQDRQDLFNQALASGIHTPFIYPWDTLPVALLACGLLFTPQLPRIIGKVSRLLLTIVTLIYLVLRWPHVRTVGFTAGYGLGLVGFWGFVMTVLLLVLHDPGKDFQRIEINKTYVLGRTLQEPGDNIHLNRLSTAATKRNNNIEQPPSVGCNGSKDAGDGLSKFVWQTYPQEFLHRLDWCIDLMTTFRWINWNYRISIKTYIVPPPEGVPPQLSDKATKLDQGALSRLQRSAVRNFFTYYIVLDILKTFMVTDPYWLGIAPLESPTPWAWLRTLNEITPGATRFVRLSVSLISVISALTFVFSLSPIFFATILPYILGDKLYKITKSPLLEVWMYPPQWGSMFDTLCGKGLAGMWAIWWHQMFRFGISEPSQLLTRKWNIDQRSQTGRVVQLLIAFGLTAGIHAAASSTTFSIIPGRPSQPFIFFMAQAVGILVQTETSKLLNGLMKFPRTVRRAANFAFVFIFMWYIGPFLSNDFARCQIWLFEPIPISILRGLGFGPGDCWIPWLSFPEGGRWLGWWNGDHWYSSGIGIF